jgi:hypothetical protein
MFKARSLTVIACAMLAASALNAQSPETSGKPAKPGESRAVQGVLTGQNGEQLKFALPEGGGIRVKDQEGNITYRLIPEKVTKDQAELNVIDIATNQGVERFKLNVGGTAQSSTAVPFSLALTEITTRSTAHGAGHCGLKSASGDATIEADCCVECGGATFCCEPDRGWCCSLECSSGGSCSACSAI